MGKRRAVPEKPVIDRRRPQGPINDGRGARRAKADQNGAQL